MSQLWLFQTHHEGKEEKPVSDTFLDLLQVSLSRDQARLRSTVRIMETALRTSRTGRRRLESTRCTSCARRRTSPSRPTWLTSFPLETTTHQRSAQGLRMTAMIFLCFGLSAFCVYPPRCKLVNSFLFSRTSALHLSMHETTNALSVGF